MLNQQSNTYSVEGAISRTIGPKAKMNQHNSDIGRSITEKSLYRKCKCHGVSSSCDVRSCWYTLPPLEQIAERLKERYNTAHMINPHHTDEIKIDTRSMRTAPISGKQDLVYLKMSPDYCEEDVDLGSFGTRMRKLMLRSWLQYAAS
uniref:Protein Wnt n=1 Tax=Ditylenchus dipsaci TaxID=166011 RepID=A0A915E7W9_9BILA